MQANRKVKKKNIVWRLLLIGLALNTVIAIFSMCLQLRARREVLDAIETEIKLQELLNESLQEKTDNSDFYLEEEARDQGYSLPGEQIYQVVPEN